MKKATIQAGMTPEEYKQARKARGTQQEIAAVLGLNYRTIQRREAGASEITAEAVIALLSLPAKHKGSGHKKYRSTNTGRASRPSKTQQSARLNRQ